MQCPECWYDVPAESAFCNHCGHELARTRAAPRQVVSRDLPSGPLRRPQPEPAPQPQYTPPPKAGWSATGILTAVGVWLLLLFALVGGGLFIYDHWPEAKKTEAQASAPDTTPRTPPIVRAPAPAPVYHQSTPNPAYAPPPDYSQPPTPQPTPAKIVEDEFALPPGYYKVFSFNVLTGARLSGHFEATRGNNVQVHVLDSDGFENLKSHAMYRTYYDSGRVAVGSINLNLAPGTYYLVFENMYSILSSKSVHASVSLEPQ